jgi:formate dehydrogenase major subunit
VAGRFVWRAWGRGDQTTIRPAANKRLGESECVSCGACADTCPTGAIIDKDLIADGPTSEIRTVCPYCGVGCELLAYQRDGRIRHVRPAIDAAVNKGHMCVKGRYGWDFAHAADRATQPMIRTDGDWRKVSWDEAIAFVASRLKGIVAEHGPDAVGVLGSSRATNEENYLTQKFARVVIGTNNVDCCARVCHAPTAVGMKLMLGAGAATNSFDDIERAKVILVIGANPTENHPVIGDRINQATRRGAKLIVVDPRRIDLANVATIHLQLHPGTNVALLNAMAHVIVKEGLYDADMAPRRLDNWDGYRQFIDKYSPEAVADLCGIPATLIREAARLYASASPAMCFHGLGVTEHTQGVDGVICLVNLALLTGNIGRAGAGVNPLRGQNNVQGAAHMGCDPQLLTGGTPLSDGRSRFEAVWRTSIPETPGLDLMRMMDAAQEGRLRALWAIGYDVALTNPNMFSTLRALKSIELVVIQDLYLTETANAVGKVFLPACSSFEKEGTFMNAERRIQLVRKVIEPVGESLPDWQIICRLAGAMGRGELFDCKSPQDIWDEIREVWPAAAGVIYPRLERGGLQWPCPAIDHPGTPLLHTDIAEKSRRFELRMVDFLPTGEQASAEYPLILNTGRSLYQFNAGTMSGRSRIAQLQPIDELAISPEDASALDIVTGDQVRVVSRFGEVVMPAHVSRQVRAREAFATFQSPQLMLNRLTSRRRDRITHTPEYKVTAIRVEKMSAARGGKTPKLEVATNSIPET